MFSPSHINEEDLDAQLERELNSMANLSDEQLKEQKVEHEPPPEPEHDETNKRGLSSQLHASCSTSFLFHMRSLVCWFVCWLAC